MNMAAMIMNSSLNLGRSLAPLTIERALGMKKRIFCLDIPSHGFVIGESPNKRTRNIIYMERNLSITLNLILLSLILLSLINLLFVSAPLNCQSRDDPP